MTKAPTLLPYTSNTLIPLLAGPIRPIHKHTKAKTSNSKLTSATKTNNNNNKEKPTAAQKKPVDLLRLILHSSAPPSPSSQSKAVSSSNKKTLSFEKPSEEDIKAYDLETVKAIRTNNIGLLRQLWSNGKGKSMNACNQFGESVLHMACRRGYTKIADFLLREVKVRIDRCDDFGRNPYHDALWTSIPNFDIVDLLIEFSDPLLMLSEDVRGNTPFAYARHEHNELWVTFLEKRKQNILNRINATTNSYNNDEDGGMINCEDDCKNVGEQFLVVG
mmetsp:Transcript_21534/g.21864  ORF Transcript_21534/g.21864 Transcript_21534/m.21864 type:complete len:275 (+) Transcript_21534:60-884(+)